MEFAYKPDYEDACRHWRAFWAGEIIDRPCICITAPAEGAAAQPHPPGLQHPERDPLAAVRAYDRFAQSVRFLGDAMPFFCPNFGPDIYAAFVGADLEGFSAETGTSWATPFVKDWTDDSLRLDTPHGYWWEAALSFVAGAREIAEGKFGVGVFDLHSNLDCLAAIRGPQQLCMDCLDRPEDIDKAMAAVRRSYRPIYDALYHASGQDSTGTSTWLPMYCEGKFATIQCDFICMIGPEHLRRFVLPALEEEAAFLDHCCYHYDGPEALVHLDDILGIDAIDAIQWVPGAGNRPHIEWMDLLKTIQQRGKSLWVGATVDEVPIYHRELRPERVVYHVAAQSESEAESLLEWLRSHT